MRRGFSKSCYSLLEAFFCCLCSYISSSIVSMTFRLLSSGKFQDCWLSGLPAFRVARLLPFRLSSFRAFRIFRTTAGRRCLLEDAIQQEGRLSLLRILSSNFFNGLIEDFHVFM